MFKDSEKGREGQKHIFHVKKQTESSGALEKAEERCAAPPPGKVIDLKERASDLRIKKTFSGYVDQTDAAAAAALGEMFLNGEGVGADPLKAAKFLALAAKGGIAQSMHQLALLHIAGEHVPYDPKYALTLLESACEQDHVPAIISLAELHIFGQHCARNTEKALELLYRVVFENEPSVYYYLAYIYDKFPTHHDPHEAAYWYRRASEYGHYKSQIRLAALYALGQGVPRCHETAEAFLQVALESTPPQDPKLLCWQGERLARRPETEFLAQALIKAAAEMHYSPAQRLILQHGWR